MNARLDQLIASAVAEGILQPGTTLPTDEQRPWPVIVLTGLGAWLSAIPLLLLIATALHGALLKGAAPYIVGVVMLVATVMVLRAEKLPLFVEQFALPGLLVGGGMLAYGLEHDFGDRTSQVVVGALALIIADLVARGWLRILLGAAACFCALLAVQPQHHAWEPFMWWLSAHVTLAAWVSLPVLGRRWDIGPRRMLMLEWTGLGWIVVTLITLAVSAGMTFLAGASLPSDGGDWHGEVMRQPWRGIAQAGSALLASCAAAWIARCWRSLRQAWSCVAALVLVALAWLMPALGACLLVVAICCTARRWRLAMAGGAAAAWIIGAFYYQLSYPLGSKALMLVAAGALLAAIAWIALRGGKLLPAATRNASDSVLARIGIASCAIAVLAVANVGIWQKETLIADGRPVFVAMAPADPRSLMQGDYMRLNFAMAPALQGGIAAAFGSARVQARGKIDDRGILTLERLASAAPAAAGELDIELTPNGRRWMVVTDAWYFKEGEAERWSRAKYGEFRVRPDGQALLVGLRGPNLEPL